MDIAECLLSLESRRSNTIKSNVRFILKADISPYKLRYQIFLSKLQIPPPRTAIDKKTKQYKTASSPPLAIGKKL